jgi:GxxExxY protein
MNLDMRNMRDMNLGEPSSAIKNDDLTEVIIWCAIRLHRVFGPEFLEVIYHRRMAHELRKIDLTFVDEARMQVTYDGVVLGDYIADFLVADRVVIEIKAVSTLTKAHEIQLVNYLNAVKFDLGLLINFGGSKIEVKRKYREAVKSASDSIHVPHVTHV